ncbi:MAG: AMP-binding protein [Nitrospira sp.]
MSKHPPSAIHNLPELFEFRCRRQPNELAYASVRDNLELENQLTYAQLECAVRSLAGRLVREVPPGTNTLLLYPSGLDAACAFWACLYAGLVPVPAPAPDLIRLKYSLPRLHRLISDARASFVLTSSRMTALSSELSRANEAAPVTWIATDQSRDEVYALDAPRPDTGALAYLQYTSGSTASPRGVMITHDNVLAHCKALTLAGHVSDGSRSLCWLPYFHDYGLLHGIIAPFYAGIPAYLMSPVTFLRRPLRWLDAIARWSITHSGGPNFAYEACLRAVARQKDWQTDLRSWQVASCGAEPIHPETARRFIDGFGAWGFAPTSFAPAYGLAEATLLVTMKPIRRAPSLLTVDADALARSLVTESDPLKSGTRTLVGCGEPLDATRIKIVNPTTRLECPQDAVGEVWLAGPGVASGYWNKQEETEVTFKATLADSGESPYLRTGDLGFLYRGELFLTGRIKDLIIVRGRNYYPHDLEWTAQQAHPGLRRGGGAVFSIDDQTGERVVLVHEIESQLSESEWTDVVNSIRRVVADEYELELHHVVLVKSGTIPKTSSGKIQRAACRAAYESGQLTIITASTLDATTDAEGGESASAGPSTPIENRLADIWQEVLGVARPHLQANFFEVGGNSLLAAQLTSRILDEFHVHLPLSAVFECATVSALARRITELSVNRTEPTIRGQGGSGELHIPIVAPSRIHERRPKASQCLPTETMVLRADSSRERDQPYPAQCPSTWVGRCRGA